MRNHLALWCAGWFLVLIPLSGNSQSFADSLRQVINGHPEDTTYVNLLNDLAWELKFDEPQEARDISQKAIEVANKLNFPKGKGNALNQLGVIETIHGDLDKAIAHYNQAMTVRSEIGDQNGVGNLHNNIANLLESKGDLIGALDSYQKGLRIQIDLRDSAKMVRSYYNLSNLYSNLGNYSEALDYIFRYLEWSTRNEDMEGQANAWNIIGNLKFELDRPREALAHYQKSLELHRALDNDWEAASVLNNLGNILDELAENSLDNNKHFAGAKDTFLLAIEYLEEAQTIRQSSDNDEGLAEVYNNIAIVRKNLGSYYDDNGNPAFAKAEWTKSLDLLNQSLGIRQKLEDQLGIVEVYNGIGDVYRRLGNYDKALFYTQEYFKIAEEIGARRYLVNGYKDLSRIYDKLGNYELAFENRKEYDQLRYELINEQRVTDNERREVLYSDRQKQWQSEKELFLRDAQLEKEALYRNFLYAGALALGLLAFLLFNRNRIKTRANAALQEKNEIISAERKRSDDLLLNILPESTAKELKEKGSAEARQHDSVTVLFTDFKAFTQIAEQLTPEELVHELDRYFRTFDEITKKHGVEKIKTIGDAYMCAGGLPDPLPDHALRVVRAAQEIISATDQFNSELCSQGKPEFGIRVGIHSGPVVSGIVGSRKFAYDIWGDTVNIASRMESSGEPGKINISESTYELIKNDFKCVPRGKVKAKNKGEMMMYFVMDDNPKPKTHNPKPIIHDS